MSWFEGSHARTIEVKADAARAIAHFADLATVAAHTEGLERHEIEGEVLRFVMKEQDHAGIVKYKGDYRSRYRIDGDRVVWTAEGGNGEQSGEARFTPLPAGGTSIAYRETVRVDMDVPALMAPMIAPFVGPMIAQEIAGYLDRMVKSLEG